MKKITVVLLFLLLHTFSYAEVYQDDEGWTVVVPSEDTRIIYVSSSMGSDDNDGLSENTPVKSIEKAYSLLRSGYPDWMLFKRGDVWYESFPFIHVSGRSEQEPMLFSSYGTGARPLIKSKERNAIRRGGGDNIYGHLYIIGFDFYAYKRDPDSPDYDETYDANYGFSWTGGGHDILIEDCSFRFFSGAVGFQRHTGAYLTDVRVRRSTLLNSYSYSSHSQGLYVDKVDGLLVEECIFDHNGWLIQGPGDGSRDGGAATMFNHNVYITATNDIVLRGNTFLRSSSIQNKMTSNQPGESRNILIEDNLYVDGEIGISIGGNTDDSLRFVDTVIRDNVMMYLGKSRPTGRDLAWYIDIVDNVNTVVQNNVLIHQTWSNNAYVFRITGDTQRGVEISRNVIYGIRDKGIRSYAKPGWSDVHIHGNYFQDPGVGMEIHYHMGGFESVRYSDNIYYREGEGTFARIENSPYTHDEWAEASGETGSEYRRAPFPDPDRSVESYYAFVGGDGTYEGFIAQMRKQSRDEWNSAFTASAINAYIRDGFRTESTGTSVDERHAPDELELSQNYPNPFNPGTTIPFALNREAGVQMSIYNILGQRIAVLVNGKRYTAGTHHVYWNGKDSSGFEVPGGVYIYVIRTDDYSQQRKMTLIR
ncbi:T9SS type A sorting domain-containing protein [Balneolaceae bacterium ANBcel3]|nr:T9SS type A sorting domain-containing protein [Balneolaceae bacterium ANBcel3]